MISLPFFSLSPLSLFLPLARLTAPCTSLCPQDKARSSRPILVSPLHKRKVHLPTTKHPTPSPQVPVRRDPVLKPGQQTEGRVISCVGLFPRHAGVNRCQTHTSCHEQHTPSKQTTKKIYTPPFTPLPTQSPSPPLHTPLSLPHPIQLHNLALSHKACLHTSPYIKT